MSRSKSIGTPYGPHLGNIRHKRHGQPDPIILTGDRPTPAAFGQKPFGHRLDALAGARRELKDGGLWRKAFHIGCDSIDAKIAVGQQVGLGHQEGI